MNGLRVYSPPPATNGGMSNFDNPYLYDGAYDNQGDQVQNGPYSPGAMNGNNTYSQLNRPRDQFDEDVMSGNGDRAAAGMTRSDRFGTTTLFDPGRDPEDERDQQVFDDPFDLPNPNDAAMQQNGGPYVDPYGYSNTNAMPMQKQAPARNPGQGPPPVAPRPNHLQVAVPGDNRPFSPAVLSHNGPVQAGPFSPGGYNQPQTINMNRPFSPAGQSVLMPATSRTLQSAMPAAAAAPAAPAPAMPTSTIRSNQSGDKSVQLADAIELLASPNDAVRSHAAAYIQHLLFRDDDAKNRCRQLNGIPRLVHLIETGRAETIKAGLGVLLNISTGRNNDENKRAIVTANGLEVLFHLLTTPQESAEVHELVTGVIWNIASCRDIRRVLLDRAVQPLVDYVIKPHAERAFKLLQEARVLASQMQQQQQQNGLSPNNANVPGELAQRTYELRVANQQAWSTVLRNATGALRCLSADGELARRRLRESRFLINSMLVFVRLATETRDFSSDRDNKVIENVMCILRNVSYALQELADPNYTKRRLEELSLMHSGGNTNQNPPASTAKKDNQGTVTCFRSTKKSTDTSRTGSSTRQMQVLLPPALSANDDLAQLWQPDTVRLYQTILAECCNPQTIEAAAGTLQNLTACDWQPSVEIRAQLRKEKALPIMVDLLNLNTDSIVLATVLCIRNLIVDQRNKELIGKHALAQLGAKLPLDERDVQNDPRSSRYCTVNDLTQATLAAILATIHELVAMPTKQELADAERLRKKLEQQAARRQRDGNNQAAQSNPEDEMLAAAIKQANPAFARTLLDSGCIPRLFFIVRSSSSEYDNANAKNTMKQRFDPKVTRFAQAVLYQLWLYAELRSDFLQRGWIERDFVPAAALQSANANATGALSTTAAANPQPQPANGPQLQANTVNRYNTAQTRQAQSTIGPTSLTMRSQPPMVAAPLPPNMRMQTGPTMSRVGSPPPSQYNMQGNNGPHAYSNTVRSGIPPALSNAGTMMPGTAIGGPGAGMTFKSNDRQQLLNASPARLGASQQNFNNGEDMEVNAVYGLGGGGYQSRPNTMPRPGGNLSTMPRDMMVSQGGLEPTYTRVDKRGSNMQPAYDPQSGNNTLNHGQNGPYSSTLQLVSSRSQGGNGVEDPVADSWV